jgi:hypothetical protein
MLPAMSLMTTRADDGPSSLPGNPAWAVVDTVIRADSCLNSGFVSGELPEEVHSIERCRLGPRTSLDLTACPGSSRPPSNTTQAAMVSAFS